MFDVVNSDVTTLRDASRHILEAGGKRIRPRLVLLSYMAMGGQDLQKVVPVAAALELVHTASVVRDDINDHGVVRRGRPSVNAIWGRTFALLTGDFLFTKVYELMAPYADLNIIFSEATVALVEGETLQAAAVKDDNFSRQVYYDIIARKTAALFKAGAKLGAKLAGANDRQTEALGQYGFNIGLAFQIVDDILDLTADETQLGKTTGIDIEQGRGFASIVDESDPTAVIDPMAAIKRKMGEQDTINEAHEQADKLVQIATIALNSLPFSQERDALNDLAQSVIARNY
ncbi:MAG: polyprenyl synthetase family protein [Chitinophagaceae bacterium]|nr:polyprenyl synthetase family protein [Anaerolineae bacterium]